MLSEERLKELIGEVERYGFTSKATGEELVAEVRRLQTQLNEVTEEWQLADDDAINTQEEYEKLEKENQSLRDLIRRMRVRGYPTGLEWVEFEKRIDEVIK